MVIRAHFKPAPITSEFLRVISDEASEDSSDAEFIWSELNSVQEPISEGVLTATDILPSEGVRDSASNEFIRTEDDCFSAYNLTVKEAYATLDQCDVDNSILTELGSMESHKVWSYVTPADVDAGKCGQ